MKQDVRSRLETAGAKRTETRLWLGTI